mmetsp:Transcript_37151/g.90310  ORF Transcript_37151/g.90310 Transcript_37151/m.90310 type:complete len:82 (+) Transcript_37151:423-668(+)
MNLIFIPSSRQIRSSSQIQFHISVPLDDSHILPGGNIVRTALFHFNIYKVYNVLFFSNYRIIVPSCASVPMLPIIPTNRHS